MLAIDQPRAEGHPVFVAEQRLRQDDEDPIGVVSAPDTDLLRHAVDKSEDIADREIVAGRLRVLNGSPLNAQHLQKQKPGNDAGNSNFCVALNRHLGARSACRPNVLLDRDHTNEMMYALACAKLSSRE